jgi:hypothetical protein
MGELWRVSENYEIITNNWKSMRTICCLIVNIFCRNGWVQQAPCMLLLWVMADVVPFYVPRGGLIEK